MTIGLCFGSAVEDGPSAHIAVGATHARWPEGSWLAEHAHVLRDAEPTAAGKQVLASICSAYRRSVEDLMGAGVAEHEARQRMVLLPAAAKPLRLPSHRWLEISGKTGRPKEICVMCAGTSGVSSQYQHPPPAADYWTKLFDDDNCAEKRLCLPCVEREAAERQRLLGEDIGSTS
jgi:hypothetical protein